MCLLKELPQRRFYLAHEGDRCRNFLSVPFAIIDPPLGILGRLVQVSDDERFGRFLSYASD